MGKDTNTLNIYQEHFSEAFIREWNRKRYCRACGSPLRYDSLGEYRCMTCGRSELDDYGKVRKFLDENGSAPAKVIEAQTGVPAVIINELLAKGKIQIAGDKESYVKCSSCGAPIKFGRICAACAAKQADGMKSLYASGVVGDAMPQWGGETAPEQTKQEKAKPRMYTWVKGHDR